MQCKAKAKSTGKQCRRNAVTGMRVCYVHGGATPKGIMSPNWKTGRYSKYLPTGLMEKYQEALTDRELLNLSDEIALLRTRQFQLIGRINTNEAKKHWNKIDTNLKMLIEGLQERDNEKSKSAVLDLQESVKAAKTDYAVWGEIMDMAERIRKLSETEGKRRKDMQLMIQAEDATNFVVTIAMLAKEYVPEKDLKKFHDRLMGLVHRSSVIDTAG